MTSKVIFFFSSKFWAKAQYGAKDSSLSENSPLAWQIIRLESSTIFKCFIPTSWATANPVKQASYSEMLEHRKSSLKDLAIVYPSSLMSAILAPLEVEVEEPSNLKVQVEFAISAKSASPTSLGTSCEVGEVSSPGN